MPDAAVPASPAPSVRIREAELPDLDAVVEIQAHYAHHTVTTFSEEPMSVAEWAQSLQEKRAAAHPFLIAEQDGIILGFAYAGHWRRKSAYRHTVEDTIYLRPGAEGRGVGRALLTELLARCEAAGHRQVIAVLTDDASTAASYALHVKLGFTEVGRLGDVGIKRGQTLSTVLMQRSLGS
ncbi:N-acetyltransferase [Nesterenkonia sp. E16_7]|uniref:GNAT family N-acetyltransferase n=1 Tax=unclassified Nesterenkonia TaxID=2629769 RepID=UPI001A91F085|nr:MULTISPECIES: GNAT family N-acetyltransferase [unclassified Nesterenkonia]MBO0595367.1 N-acetyltransferase [Nesterenkonia sp. E16_10]MBO0599185.1 N-acetyltransferase [Nesterenkonia sp. E16_7]